MTRRRRGRDAHERDLPESRALEQQWGNALQAFAAVQEQLGAHAVQWMEKVNDEEHQAAKRPR